MGVRSVHAQTEAVHAWMHETERKRDRQTERERGRERGRERQRDRETERERAFIRSVFHNGGSRTVTLARDYTCAHTH